MFEVRNNKAYINGSSGFYDNKIANPFVRYGRNAANNYLDYTKSLGLKTVDLPDVSGLSGLDEDKFELRMQELEGQISKIDEAVENMAPIDFEYTYSENGFNELSLVAASYEELGGTEIKTSDLTKILKKQFDEKGVVRQIIDNVKAFFKGETLQALNFSPIRLNADVLDINRDGKIDVGEYAACILLSDELSDGKIDGVINNDGENKSLAYANRKNKRAAEKTFKKLYQDYDLGLVSDIFMQNKNNLS